MRKITAEIVSRYLSWVGASRKRSGKVKRKRPSRLTVALPEPLPERVRLKLDRDEKSTIERELRLEHLRHHVHIDRRRVQDGKR